MRLRIRRIFQFSLENLWRARWDLNPGSPAPQAGVIIRTRRRAQLFTQKIEGRIVNTLLKLKNSGKISTLAVCLRKLESYSLLPLKTF